jgi:hypothetical protein
MDALAVHSQSLYIVCGTAIPVLFVALALTPAGRTFTMRKEVIEAAVQAAYPLAAANPLAAAVPIAFSLLFRIPVKVRIAGLLVMLVGELASLLALGFDWASPVLMIIAAAGVVAGALFVAATVAPAPSSVAVGDRAERK